MTLDEILNDPTIEAVTVETDEIHLTKYAQLLHFCKDYLFLYTTFPFKYVVKTFVLPIFSQSFSNIF